GDVPTAVGNLLVATKGLEAALRQWGEQRVSENEVSDTYVVVGTEFNNMITAFAQHQIDLSEIHTVPTDLRNVLESCLGEEPSPHALAEYMPDVRQIVWDLLWALRAKRDLWKRAAGAAPAAVSAISAGGGGRGYL
ncbi:hypothetical protein FIBSPDRAFT_757205, partial [Athelia psychrophila]